MFQNPSCELPYHTAFQTSLTPTRFRQNNKEEEHPWLLILVLLASVQTPPFAQEFQPLPSQTPLFQIIIPTLSTLLIGLLSFPLLTTVSLSPLTSLPSPSPPLLRSPSRFLPFAPLPCSPPRSPFSSLLFFSITPRFPQSY